MEVGSWVFSFSWEQSQYLPRRQCTGFPKTYICFKQFLTVHSKVADLMVMYPSMLKMPLEPSQNGPRPNIAHVINKFRVNSISSLKDRKLVTSPPLGRHCTLGVDLIQLVPYDRSLWLILETLEKHPPLDAMEGTEVSLRNFALAEAIGTSQTLNTMSETPREKFRYLSDIASNIKIGMEGLFYVYTGLLLLEIPRIQWPAEQKPRFHVETKPHAENIPANLHRCPMKKRKPHDEREYVWLEAFLKVVTWIEKEFDASTS
jgi:hypothetical protein